MAADRQMSLTPELVALCYREEPELQRDTTWTPLTDEDYVAISRRLAETNREQDLWVFAYGSLIWNPVFETVERKRATAFGWHRSFSLEMTTWRATRQQMGLMMALERGGRCEGVIYRLPSDDTPGQVERLLRREAWDHEAVEFIRWMPTMTADGPVHALGFWVGPTGEGVSRKLELDKVAEILARACGYAGSCAEYLYNTVSHLEEFGIRDRNLWKLQKLVADEIRSINGY
jgi:cation transport protein ChaC